MTLERQACQSTSVTDKIRRDNYSGVVKNLKEKQSLVTASMA